jgi:chromosome segregation ATPase
MDGFTDSFCTMLADTIVQTREEIAGLVRRAVNLEERLAQLEDQPDVDPGEIDRVRHDLAEVNRQLADAQERLMVLENEYNFARNPVLG